MVNDRELLVLDFESLKGKVFLSDVLNEKNVF